MAILRLAAGIFVLAAATALVARAAAADEDYPTRPVKIIAPFGPGGPIPPNDGDSAPAGPILR